jgi:hypothetical protein
VFTCIPVADSKRLIKVEWGESRKQLEIGLLIFLDLRLTTRSDTTQKTRDNAYDVAIMDGMRYRKCPALAKKVTILQI